jgi:hypothetical protein
MTISGSALAVALIATTSGVGLLVVRTLVRRHEVADSPVTDTPRTEDESPEPDRDDAVQELDEVAPEQVQHDAREPAAPESGEGTPEEAGPPRAEHMRSGDGPDPVTVTEPLERPAAGSTAEDRSDGPPATVGNGPPRPDRASQSGAGQPTTKVVLFDSRLTQRIVFDSRARLQWPGHDVVCTTVDLSMHGVGCRLPPDLPPESRPASGSTVDITLNLDGRSAVLRARVRWGQAEETGAAMSLHFVKLGATQEAQLQSVVISGTPCGARSRTAS